MQDDALLHLARVMGVERGVATWRQACRTAGVVCDVDRPMPPEDLARAAEALARTTGPAGPIGRGLAIRARTYILLTRSQNGAAS
ncbi:MAG TPA: hypothetical protein VFH27_02250 [Longimicrobiaceae bacterium]|nr:hypothetical protein [Longimicrobiaceae bacterium]